MAPDDDASVRVSPTLDADTSFLLARASALSAAAGNTALRELGLKVRSYSVLALAAEVGPSQRDLAERLRLDPSQVVSLVDELEACGLVKRRLDPSDRRARIVVATTEGQGLFARAREAIAGAQRETHAPLTGKEQLALGDLLRRLAYADLR
ncbi:MarR family winged helix-turn-helix transcriptional regulator [Demequina mangrovi]|uniref:Transcriptional regulator, MarR family n=1 Tax=Demequina mangrovi TaxID=1043493 RepID=A0A1H6UXA4_9MICO|nr:MarR family winged helix-turn-helix transcriptional regulator [Demequina mangrovi]SEI92655.1 transcriptional regulator, MarR family [Demequina mangrovi]